MNGPSTPLGCVCLIGLSLGFSAPAFANDRLDKKLFLLGRALKNDDCQQAVEMSDKLVAEFGDDASVYWARARSRVCMGDYVGAWSDMRTYRDMGGSDAGAFETSATVQAGIEILTLRVEPRALELPEDFMAGVVVSVSGRHAMVRDGPGRYRIALEPGQHNVLVMRVGLPVTPWDKVIEAKAGRQREVVATPVVRIGRLVVRIEPADEASNVHLAWRPRSSTDDAEWTPLTADGSGRFIGRLAAGEVDLKVQPLDPRIGWASGSVAIVPGVETETSLTVNRLEAATLRVGDLDPALGYTLQLPTGEFREVEGAVDIETGAGQAGWAVDWEISREGTVALEPGNTMLPLPRAVELTSPTWQHPQRWMFDPSAESDDASVEPIISGRHGFAVTIPDLAPGELRRVVLDPPDVPALRSHAAMLDARRDWQESRRHALLAAGATTLLAGFTGLTLSLARTSAEKAQGLTESSDADTYAKLVEQTAVRDRLANIGLWSGLAATGLTTTLTWRSLGKSKTHKAHADQFDAARKTPHVAGAVQSLGGDEG